MIEPEGILWILAVASISSATKNLPNLLMLGLLPNAPYVVRKGVDRKGEAEYIPVP